jgi:hypothetical protein
LRLFIKPSIGVPGFLPGEIKPMRRVELPVEVDIRHPRAKRIDIQKKQMAVFTSQNNWLSDFVAIQAVEFFDPII